MLSCNWYLYTVLNFRFYDAENPDLTKNVVQLQVFIEGVDEPYENETISTLTDSIALPIQVNQNLTRYRLVLPGDEEEGIEDNEDVFEITYVKEDEFVSRSCGYRALFYEGTAELEQDQDNWIVDLEAQSEPLEITNEERAHVKIFH